MKFTILALLTGAALVSASPTMQKRAEVTDTDILNYALTLEYLEATFYQEALSKYDESAFKAANADRQRFTEIAAQEAQHVSFLAGALGSNATAACKYSFPYTDVESFITLASVIESVGVSAYLGAAAFIQNKDYLTAAGSILTTEARHQAYLGHVTGGAPWSGPEDTPLSFNDVYSLVAPFITSCPESNPALPVKAFPALNVTSSNNTAGSELTVSYNATNGTDNGSVYAAFFSGLNTTFVPLSNNTARIPNFNGTAFVVLTSSNDTVSDANTLAGPAVLSLGGFPAANPAGLIGSKQANSNNNNSGSNSNNSSGSSSSGASTLTLSSLSLGAIAVAAISSWF